MMTQTNDPFWVTTPLRDMTKAQWESLCDGCGQCCIVLLGDEEMSDAEGPAPEYFETSVACQLFDPSARRCTRYDERQAVVPQCMQITPENASTLNWMPESCAYRRLADGRGLASWHPLVSGRASSVAEAGVAVADDLVCETKVPSDDLWEYVIGIRRTL